MDLQALPIASAAHYFFGIMMFATSLFLILLVLVQRGRGGGLAGAFGGMGGQSAFGTKAGDLFTKLTMGAAAFWIVLCVFAISILNRQSTPLGGGGAPSALESLEGGAGTTAPESTESNVEPGLGAAGLGGAVAPAEAGETSTDAPTTTEEE